MQQTKKLAAMLLAAAMLLSSVACLVKEDSTSATDAAPANVTTAQATADTTDKTVYQTDRSAVAITLDDMEITAGEVEDGYDSLMQMFTYYGMSAPTDDASIDEYVNMVVEQLVTEQTPAWKAAELGLALTDAELADVDVKAHNDADAEYEDLMLYYASQVIELADDVETTAQMSEEDRKTVEEHIDSLLQSYYDDETMDLDVYLSDVYDSMYRQYLNEAYTEKLREYMTATFTVDAETVDKWYAEELDRQKTDFDEDPTLYRDTRDAILLDSEETPLLYVPEGLAAIRVIRIAPEGEEPAELAANMEKLAALETEYGKLSLNAGDAARIAAIETEYAELTEANKVLYDGYYGTIDRKAEALHARLEAGEDFAAVAAEVDPDAKEEILYYAGTDPNYAEIIGKTVADMADGTYSQVLSDGSARYIVYLEGKLTAGAVERLAVEDQIRAAAETAATADAWDEQLTAWEDEALAAATYNKDAYAYVGR